MVSHSVTKASIYVLLKSCMILLQAYHHHN
uniref:Uncharacterized protein n=1 Tax=Rhizophora mucronata TaxID=61149 RepID=A0A2P2QKS2_RHIMU